MSQRLSHLRLDRLHGDPERARDLGVSEPLASAQLEHFAAARRELGNSLGERGAQLGRNELRRTGGVDALFADEMRLGATLDVRMPQLVERAVARGAQQIRP